MTSDVHHPDHWHGQRLVPLEGGRNFRDLGGYAVEDGRTIRWGLLYRAGSPAGLTEQDWSALCKRGLRAVCDLRTQRERLREPFAWLDAAGPSYWTGEYEASFAELRETMNAGFLTGDEARAGMIAGYRELPFEQSAAYRQLFAHLKVGDLPLIFNCTAGKDRTGVAAAIVLSALGVNRDTVIEDFTLTNDVLKAENVIVSKPNGRLSQQPREVIDAIGSADPAYIEAALETIDLRHGSIAAFLEDMLGISEEDLSEIRAILLE